MPDDHAYRVRTVLSGWGGAPGLSTYYFQPEEGSADEPAAVADISSRVHAFWASLNTIMPAAWRAHVSPEVDLLNLDSGAMESTVTTADLGLIAGTSGAGFGPQLAMICGTLNTSGIIDGRRVRGRTFIGPLYSLSQPDGTPFDTDVSAVRDGLTTMLGGTSTHPPAVVWSRPRGVSLSHPTGLGGSGHVINSVSVSDKYAYLTSRRQ